MSNLIIRNSINLAPFYHNVCNTRVKPAPAEGESEHAVLYFFVQLKINIVSRFYVTENVVNVRSWLSRASFHSVWHPTI